MGNKMDTWEDIGNVIDGIKNVYDTVQQGVETYASIDNGEVRDNYMRICCIVDANLLKFFISKMFSVM